METKTSGLILVGGASSRMGKNKALEIIDGEPILLRVANALRPLCDETLLITNDGAPYKALDLRQIPDVEQGYGPLMGLYSGLLAARHERTLLLACDMPFVSPALLRFLLDQAEGYDVVIPRTKEGLHPLCALYRRSTCIPAITAAIDARKRRVISFFEQVRVCEIGEQDLRRLDPAGLALMNVNTPEELALAREIAGGMANSHG